MIVIFFIWIWSFVLRPPGTATRCGEVSPTLIPYRMPFQMSGLYRPKADKLIFVQFWHPKFRLSLASNGIFFFPQTWMELEAVGCKWRHLSFHIHLPIGLHGLSDQGSRAVQENFSQRGPEVSSYNSVSIRSTTVNGKHYVLTLQLAFLCTYCFLKENLKNSRINM